MLFLDGVYVERPDGSLRLRWVKAPTSAELAGLTQSLARRIGRFHEREGLLERDAKNSYLAFGFEPSAVSCDSKNQYLCPPPAFDQSRRLTQPSFRKASPTFMGCGLSR